MPAGTFLELPLYNDRTAGRGEVTCRATYTAGAAGAITGTNAPDPAFSCTKSGTTGQYDLTFPKCVDIELQCNLYSPALTVSDVVITTAINPGAGTASIKLITPTGTAAYMASGDILYVRHNAITEV
jgi:hypothetical protein